MRLADLFARQQRANLITGARLLFLPPILLAGALDRREWVVGLFAAQLALDGVDGLVARRLRIESDAGRRLDTVIDLAIWLPSLALFAWLSWDTLREVIARYPHLFVIPVLTSALMFAAAYRLRGTVAAVHLYSGKLTSGLVMLLMLTLLFDRFYPLLGYLTMLSAVIFHLETIAVYLVSRDQADENVISILQVLRRRKNRG